MKAEEFDKQFDNDQDISDQLDLTQAKRPLQGTAAREYRFSNLDDCLAG
jgi:hypothetical protein